ncbi:MAG: phosphohistidine phosphatase SixA [Desulfobacteraceae bacterium]|jgi:phosphohistidine phosphatase
MPLLLVQHGKNLPKEKDPEKGLSPEGQKEVEQIAGMLRDYRVSVNEIWHSGLKRARETADIFAAYINSSLEPIKKDGIAPLDDVTELNLNPDENPMIVGHLPFMERLVSFLVTGTPDRPPVVKFQNSGVVALDKNAETGVWYIKWTLFPNIEL